jgi:hypothetical protein
MKSGVGFFHHMIAEIRPGNDKRASFSPRAGRRSGPFSWAQNRGNAPSPGLLGNPTSPRTRGEVSACESCARRAFFKKTHA